MTTDPAVPDGLDPCVVAAIRAIDEENAGDPQRVIYEGVEYPLAQLEGRLAFDWVRRLRPEASTTLLIAARGHHIRRWETPRTDYPAGRAGYHAWRSALYEIHADHLEALMRAARRGDDEVAGMRRIVLRRAIKTDAEAQVYEDAVALTFLQVQFAPFAARSEREAVLRALRRTWSKFSDAGRAAALALDLAPELRALVVEAIEGTPVSTGSRTAPAEMQHDPDPHHDAHPDQPERMA